MNIKNIIVAINKMDDKSVNYSQERYEEVKATVYELLKKIGYKSERIQFIPISS